MSDRTHGISDDAFVQETFQLLMDAEGSKSNNQTAGNPRPY